MPKHQRRVVVTGIGPVTAAGIGVDSLRAGLRAGRSPVGAVTRFDATVIAVDFHLTLVANNTAFTFEQPSRTATFTNWVRTNFTMETGDGRIANFTLNVTRFDGVRHKQAPFPPEYTNPS